MESSTLEWLSQVGSVAFTASAVAFVLLNGAALIGVAMTRDRTLVNRWTGRVLAANMVLAGTGVGIPMVTSITRLAVSALTPTVGRLAPVSSHEDVLVPPGASRTPLRP